MSITLAVMNIAMNTGLRRGRSGPRGGIREPVWLHLVATIPRFGTPWSHRVDLLPGWGRRSGSQVHNPPGVPQTEKWTRISALQRRLRPRLPAHPSKPGTSALRNIDARMYHRRSAAYAHALPNLIPGVVYRP